LAFNIHQCYLAALVLSLIVFFSKKWFEIWIFKTMVTYVNTKVKLRPADIKSKAQSTHDKPLTSEKLQTNCGDFN